MQLWETTMSATFDAPKYAVARSAIFTKQKVSVLEMVPGTQMGATRSIPAGVGTALPSRRVKTEPGRELPVEPGTTGGAVRVPLYGSIAR